jgi:hypothetical protein
MDGLVGRVINTRGVRIKQDKDYKELFKRIGR